MSGSKIVNSVNKFMKAQMSPGADWLGIWEQTAKFREAKFFALTPPSDVCSPWHRD